MSLVLGAIESGQRLSLFPHDFKDNAKLALAVDIAEHVACARFDVRDQLRDREGNLFPWDEIPLTGDFIQRAARRLGLTIGLKQAYHLRRLLLAHNLLQVVGRFRHADRPGFTLFARPRCARLPAKASVGKEEMSSPHEERIQALARLLRESYEGRGP